MHIQRRFLALIFFLNFSVITFSQTRQENSGWLAWFNTYKFSRNFGLTSDVQFRSADEWQYVRNILIRPGLTYYINAKSNATVGYAYIGSFNRLPEPSKNALTENRIWEQYIYAVKFGQTSLQNRLRLEQRSIERQAGNIFSQRLRYFARLVVPLSKQKAAFSRGAFAALQDEIFLNIQNKDKLNNSVFDQNRAYIAIGYRFSSRFDMEAGYLNQYINGATGNVSNKVIQVALYTRF
jgi:hypothetical protein